MKKLMFVAAAALCGSLLADVTSANIVGYTTYTMHADYNLYAPMFIGLNADETLDIQDLKIPNADGWGSEQIWVINENGTAATGATYTYKSLNAGEDVEGWWDDEKDCFAELPITAGQGFYICCGTDGKELQCSGAVKLGKFTATLHADYNYTGNFSPVTIDIQQLKLINTAGWGSEQIWVMNENGTAATGATFTWKSTDAGEDYDGWCDDEQDKLAELPLLPGQGLYICCANDGVGIEIDEVVSNPAE